MSAPKRREDAIAGGLHDVTVVAMDRLDHQLKRRIDDHAQLFDPSTGTFSYVDNDMSDGRAFQTATLLKDGRVLVAGGVNNDARSPG